MLLRASELEIDPNNPFGEDAFGRKEVAEGISELLASLDGPFVLSIDSPWGTGKTTFIRMLKALLENKGHPCLYFNAWETDFSDDPLVAFVGELDEIFSSFAPEEITRREALKSMRDTASIIAKRAVPAVLKIATVGTIDAPDFVEKVAGDLAEKLGGDVVDRYLKERRANDVFRKKLNQLLERAGDFGKKLPAIIFVDELDRCRPDYAVELLERIKHLFNVPNVIFVVALDKGQMRSSLSAIYGNGIDGNAYLKRFFDLELKLSVVGSDRFFDSLIKRMQLDHFFSERSSAKNNDYDSFKTIFSTLSTLWELAPRAQERSMTLAAVAMRATKKDYKFYPVEIAFMAVLKIANDKMYQDLKRGFCSIVNVVDELERLFVIHGGKGSHISAVIKGYLLAMAQNDDEGAHAYVNKLRNMIGDDENANTAYKLASNHRGLKIWQAMQKIDLAVQFTA